MKNCKKINFKKLWLLWLLVGLVAVLVFFVLLLFHRPARFQPPDTVSSREVSPYLTHELLPRLYNGSQRGETFDLAVAQQGINDIVAQLGWPRKYEGFTFSTPLVFFKPDCIELMGQITAGGTEFIITVEIKPTIDLNGLLNLNVTKVKLGAVNITSLAPVIIKRIFRPSLVMADRHEDSLTTQITNSLLNGQPFKPVFDIDDNKLRIKKVIIARDKLMIRLSPLLD